MLVKNNASDGAKANASENPEMLDVLEKIGQMNGMIDDLLKFLENKLDAMSPEVQVPQATMCDTQSIPAPQSITEAYRCQVGKMVSIFERLSTINNRVNKLW